MGLDFRECGCICLSYIVKYIKLEVKKKEEFIEYFINIVD